MILEQIYLQCLSQASYLVGDEAAGEAAVVDPRRDVDVYLEAAAARGVRITKVILTHFHADFLAGHLELRQRAGSEILLSVRADAAYPFTPLSEGDVVRLGRVSLRVLETPGHTPESISLVVHDGDPAEAPPHAVLTGDTLFIGDVGRPDLMASRGVTAEELAGMLYDSLHDKLLVLPDDVLVYPAHGAGSSCGRNLGTETVSTIGEQRRLNHACQEMSKEEFVLVVTAGQPNAPRYFAYDAELNRREHPVLQAALERGLRPLPLEEVLRAAAAGAVLLDVRDPDDYARRHLRGSVNVGLGGRFASWCGDLVPAGTPIVVIAPPGREREAATRLGRIGFDDVAGYLEGGPGVLADRPDLVAAGRRLPPEEARDAAGGDALVLDVRRAGEWEAGHVPGSLNVPLQELDDRVGGLPRDRRIIVHCRTGYRSSIAVSLLERAGLTDTVDVRGGFLAWESAGLPVEAAVPR